MTCQSSGSGSWNRFGNTADIRALKSESLWRWEASQKLVLTISRKGVLASQGTLNFPNENGYSVIHDIPTGNSLQVGECDRSCNKSCNLRQTRCNPFDTVPPEKYNSSYT